MGQAHPLPFASLRWHRAEKGAPILIPGQTPLPCSFALHSRLIATARNSFHRRVPPDFLAAIGRHDYFVLDPALPIHRDYGLDDYRAVQGDIRTSVPVQASPTKAETASLVEMAQGSQGWVRAVIGWAVCKCVPVISPVATMTHRWGVPIEVAQCVATHTREVLLADMRKRERQYSRLNIPRENSVEVARIERYYAGLDRTSDKERS